MAQGKSGRAGKNKPNPLGDDFAFSSEDTENLDARKEIKLRLPVSMHIKLHPRKITDNVTISDVVAEAVDAYFEELDLDDLVTPA